MKYNKLVLVLFLIIMQVSCSNSDKNIDPSKYEDVDSKDVQLFEPDISLKKKAIILPKAKKNYNWYSSGGVFNDTPQNIFVSSSANLSRKQSYQLHKSFSKDYHFVGNTPVILKDKLFVLGDKSILYAYKLSNLQNPVWSKTFDNTEEDIFRGGGLFVKGKYLAVTYGSDTIRVLNPNTGKERWQYKMSNISKTAPVIHKGKVFALTVDNKLYCLDLSTGFLVWVSEGAAEQLGVIKTSSIIIHKDFVVVPYSVGQIYAVSIEDGKQLWNLALNDKFSSIGDLYTPIVSGDIAYISSFNGELYALNLMTGNVEWNNNYAGGHAIWLAGNYIFTVNKDSKVASINKFTGRAKWIQDLSNYTIDSRPIIVNKKLFIPSLDGKLFVISPFNGKKIKEIQIPKAKYASPIAIQNGLYLISDRGNLLVLN